MPDAALPAGMLLDLDDTILTYDAISGAAWQAVCRAEHRHLDPEELDRVLRETRRWYWSDPDRHREGRLKLDETRVEVTLMGLRRLGVEDRTWAARLAHEFAARRDAAIGFFPGAEETLRQLVSQGVALVLMTNGAAAPQRAKIERFGLDRFFAAFLIEGELGFGKPDPRVYETGLRRLGLPPHAVWAVGDNLEWDVAGPQRLGIRGLWHDYRQRGLPPGTPVIPDGIITRLADLLVRA